MDRTKTHIQFLDHLRGVAILSVFAFHCLAATAYYGNLPWGRWFRDFSIPKSALVVFFPATFGWAGVAIFFVVSGFCIHLSFIRGAPGDWKSFYIRRFFRIYPPYLLALIIFAFVFPTSRLDHFTLGNCANLLLHALLLQNVHSAYFYGINGSFWSIALECQLYLIYPLLLALVSRFGWRRTLIGLAVLEALMRGSNGVFSVVTGHELPRVWSVSWPLYYWFTWSIGAALADAFVKNQPLPFRNSSAWMWLLLGLGCFFVKPLAPLVYMLFACFTATIIAKLCDREQPLPLHNPVLNQLRILGLYSYSFYLLHQPMVDLVSSLLPAGLKAQVWPVFLICLCTYPVLLFIAWLYYTQFETRSIALGKLLLHRMRHNAECGVRIAE